VNSKKENSYDLCPNYVREFSLLYFSSPFAIAKRLEMRLSVSPATPFSDASLPNHTKMFELVHMVTSMDDFATALSALYFYNAREPSRVLLQSLLCSVQYSVRVHSFTYLSLSFSFLLAPSPPAKCQCVRVRTIIIPPYIALIGGLTILVLLMVG
jgi:hypothetical protein